MTLLIWAEKINGSNFVEVVSFLGEAQNKVYHIIYNVNDPIGFVGWLKDQKAFPYRIGRAWLGEGIAFLELPFAKNSERVCGVLKKFVDKWHDKFVMKGVESNENLA